MTRPGHPTQHELEQFVLGRLGPPDDPGVAQVEKHLLICSYCVNIAEDTLEFAQAIQQALSAMNTPSVTEELLIRKDSRGTHLAGYEDVLTQQRTGTIG
jgi:hypothetical protein